MKEKLAINGGPKSINFNLKPRCHFGEEEKIAAIRLFDEAIEKGTPFGYNGIYEEEYCKRFSEFMGGGFADAVNSGTNAIYTALRAINPEPFSEIIVSAITDPGGMMPIPLINCIPIIADTQPNSYNTGPSQIEELISPLTSAIIVAHIGGEPADIPGIMKIARKHNIPVIEDCSQSHGAKINGRHVGSFGDIAVFSVMFGKHHCTGGQGGIVFTKDEEMYWRIRRAADRGKPFNRPGCTNGIASLNMNLNELACAIGIEQLKKLPWIVRRRQEFVGLLEEELKQLETISIPKLLPGSEHAYWWWRLKINPEKLNCSKEEFCKALQAEGVLVDADYGYALPHKQEWYEKKNIFGSSGLPWSAPQYKGNGQREFPVPNAMAAIKNHFNLTIYESWGETEAEGIIKAFKKVNEHKKT